MHRLVTGWDGNKKWLRKLGAQVGGKNCNDGHRINTGTNPALFVSNTNTGFTWISQMTISNLGEKSKFLALISVVRSAALPCGAFLKSCLL